MSRAGRVTTADALRGRGDGPSSRWPGFSNHSCSAHEYRAVSASADEPAPRAGRRAWRAVSHSAIVGPMASYRDAWSALTDRDAHALAVYLKSVAPVKNAVEQHPVTGMRD